MTLEALWIQYKNERDQESRNALLEHYLPLVKYVASKVGFGLPPHVDQGDLISYGTFGLIDALEKFDPERGYKFETYAISRIRGSILDELRSSDWIPRSIRSKARSIDKAVQRLGSELLRNPSPEEMAEELDLNMDQYNTVLGQISHAGMVGLDDTIKTQDVENVTVGDAIKDTRNTVESSFEVDELRNLFAKSLNTMGDREKIVATLYYYEGLTLGEIGTVLGVTESRICQIHTKAILGLLPQVGLSKD